MISCTGVIVTPPGDVIGDFRHNVLARAPFFCMLDRHEVRCRECMVTKSLLEIRQRCCQLLHLSPLPCTLINLLIFFLNIDRHNPVFRFETIFRPWDNRQHAVHKEVVKCQSRGGGEDNQQPEDHQSGMRRRSSKVWQRSPGDRQG